MTRDEIKQALAASIGELRDRAVEAEKCALTLFSDEWRGYQRQIAATLTARADALAEAQRVIASAPVCHVCGTFATCIGSYEDPDAPMAFACDGCCGHGGEDGKCYPLTDWPAVLAALVNTPSPEIP